MLNGALAIGICLNVSIRVFTLYLLYTKLVGARISSLTKELHRLSDKPSSKRLLSHLRHVNSVINEWEMSKRYFEKRLASYIPVVLATMIFFPSMVIVSGRLFTNRLTALYLANLFGLLLPTVLMNERTKREVGHFKRLVCSTDSEHQNL